MIQTPAIAIRSEETEFVYFYIYIGIGIIVTPHDIYYKYQNLPKNKNNIQFEMERKGLEDLWNIRRCVKITKLGKLYRSLSPTLLEY